MNEPYNIIYNSEFTKQMHLLSTAYERDPTGPEAALLVATLDAIDIVKRGEEAKHAGERLGFSKNHYDLRDCAEIKVELLDEHHPNGASMGPSHRLIYREFDPTDDDPRPIRQIIAFEHRKGGKPFKVAAERLGRRQGFAAPELGGLSNIAPATGRKKDPNRPVQPHRLPLPPDLAVALATAQKALPLPGARPSERSVRTADPPIRQWVRDR